LDHLWIDRYPELIGINRRCQHDRILIFRRKIGGERDAKLQKRNRVCTPPSKSDIAIFGGGAFL